MITHIVMWNFNEELTKEETNEIAINMRTNLESLLGKIDGLLTMKLIVNELESSNRDVALFSTFESIEALNAYQVHPEHVKVAGSFKSAVRDRVCLDF